MSETKQLSIHSPFPANDEQSERKRNPVDRDSQSASPSMKPPEEIEQSIESTHDEFVQLGQPEGLTEHEEIETNYHLKEWGQKIKLLKEEVRVQSRTSSDLVFPALQALAALIILPCIQSTKLRGEFMHTLQVMGENHTIALNKAYPPHLTPIARCLATDSVDLRNVIMVALHSDTPDTFKLLTACMEPQGFTPGVVLSKVQYSPNPTLNKIFITAHGFRIGSLPSEEVEFLSVIPSAGGANSKVISALKAVNPIVILGIALSTYQVATAPAAVRTETMTKEIASFGVGVAVGIGSTAALAALSAPVAAFILVPVAIGFGAGYGATKLIGWLWTDQRKENMKEEVEKVITAARNNALAHLPEDKHSAVKDTSEKTMEKLHKLIDDDGDPKAIMQTADVFATVVHLAAIPALYSYLFENYPKSDNTTQQLSYLNNAKAYIPQWLAFIGTLAPFATQHVEFVAQQFSQIKFSSDRLDIFVIYTHQLLYTIVVSAQAILGDINSKLDSHPDHQPE